jgi:hypothetical protein
VPDRNAAASPAQVRVKKRTTYGTPREIFGLLLIAQHPVSFRWDAHILARLDGVRGNTPRSEYVRRATEVWLALQGEKAWDYRTRAADTQPREAGGSAVMIRLCVAACWRSTHRQVTKEEEPSCAANSVRHCGSSHSPYEEELKPTCRPL